MSSTKHVRILFLLLAATPCHVLHATGDYDGPATMLDDGGKQVTGTPEFFWELECKRIAAEFVPGETCVIPPVTAPDAAKPAEEEEGTPPNPRGDFTTRMDLADFKAAIKDSSLKPADPEAATEAHADARDVLIEASATRADGKLPDEEPGEFAEYHKGAFAYKTRHPDQARAIWGALLAKPAAQRKYRSTWAAYMLGRCELDERQFAKAAGYFQQTRKLAKDGCVDSLGLAAESYGWEARCELERGHSEASARLYLTQLALGDPSAVISLKWFIPDWGWTVKGEGMEEAKPGVGEADAAADTEMTPAEKGPEASPPRGAKALAAAAGSPLLRRLVSAHILATATPVDNSNSEYLKPNERGVPQAKWLAALDKAGVKDTPDAEYIAWVAYSAGKYNDAKRWLAKSPGTSAAALWLMAKLKLRDGKIAEGTKLLSEALHVFPAPEAQPDTSTRWGSSHALSATAGGELGVLHLAQADFIQALSAFIAADYWEDAAYVAERCLTKAELLDYVREKKYPEAAPKTAADGEDTRRFAPEFLRDLVARRMVREDDYQTAKEFFSPEKIKMLDAYTSALAAGADASKSKQEQARALFHAAWIARYQGMELMGTESGPDGYAGDLAMERLTGKRPLTEDVEEPVDAGYANKPVQFTLPVTKEEKQRLQATKLVVERRYHYRHVAAGLAWKAAALLPDNSPETADVLNTAGNWLKAKHEKQADRFYQAIERRCPLTETGKQAVAKHWLVNATGPWSDAEAKLLPPE